MEDCEEKSRSLDKSKKSRSLDLQSLQKSRTSGGEEDLGLKRQRGSLLNDEWNGLGQVRKRMKGRKEVSLSSLEPFVKRTRKALNPSGSGLDSGSPESNRVGFKLNGFIFHGKTPSKTNNGLRSSENIAHSLDDKIVAIPKRPRDFSRQRKLQHDHVLKEAKGCASKRVTSLSTYSSRSNAEVEKSKLSGNQTTSVESLAGKKKRIVNDVKENNSEIENHSFFEGEENGAAPLTASLAPKRADRNCRKRHKLAIENQNVAEIDPCVEISARICEVVREDDEENLEQNAARMLSSRFDPNCTGFSGNRRDSLLESVNGSSVSPLFDQGLKSLGMIGSVDRGTAYGRVLRPRTQYKQEGFVRRRRHFYEICYKDLDVHWVVNQRIKVFWPLDKSWYFGLVSNYDPVRKLHHIKYDDRDEEWINLQNERFKLLLHPSEVPGKVDTGKAQVEEKHLDEYGDNDVVDENSMCSFMDSEPIISWLARSACRLKSSLLGTMKKYKSPHRFRNLLPSSSSEISSGTRKGCLSLGSSTTDVNKLSVSSSVLSRSADGDITEKSVMKNAACLTGREVPFVYFRKRFHKRGQKSGSTQKEDSALRSTGGSAAFLDSVFDRVGTLEEFNVGLRRSAVECSRCLNLVDALCFGKRVAFSELSTPPMKLEHVKLTSSLPVLRLIDVAFANYFWLYTTILHLQYGSLVSVWPKVHLEVLFVDDVLGLKFLLFEGCLKQAVTFVCLILSTFPQPNECGKHVDRQLPATSIGFKISGLHDLGRWLLFVFYSFLDPRSSKWLYLDMKLKHHCSVSKELPLPECTFAILRSRMDQIPVTSFCKENILLEASERRSRQGDCSSSNVDEKLKIPSFAATPTFFLSLHLKLLMENNASSVSCHDSLSLPDAGDCSPLEDSSDQVSEITIENMGHTVGQSAACAPGWLSCACSKIETDALSISNDVDWLKSSRKSINSEVNVTRTSVGCQDSGKNESDGIVVRLESCPCQTRSWSGAGKSWSSVPEDLYSPEKVENGCGTYCLNKINIHTLSSGEVGGEPYAREMQTAQCPAADLVWDMNDCTIRSPNPTAPRSTWHHNRHRSVSSFGFRSKLWPDGRVNFVRNGSRKPRSQVSYLLPFGGYEFGSKPQSHHWKGHPYKRVRDENVRRTSDGSRSPQQYSESLSCVANVLVTVSDRGWRECGADVVLESIDHNDWRLLVKFSGETKHSYKVHQFLQPGITNRYTHATMWKGGKDWILEFPDRSQWILFKAMHEECYKRNIRAASIKNIPIPGVGLIEESDDNAIEVPFVRSSPKYFQQVGTEVDMALDPSRVLYDMESDDEEWILKLKSQSGVNGNTLQEISEDMFERVMDVFEKFAYSKHCDDFTSDEIEGFMAGVGPMDVINAIYSHWQQKRREKGMALIRQFQPAQWERYQQQLKEWEQRMQNFSDGCEEKAMSVERPAMFAFCLRPRGLEISTNKGSKQRSQRKFAAVHNGSFPRDQDVFHLIGRKVNGFTSGEDKALFPVQNHESSDTSPWLPMSMKLSPGYGSTGLLSLSSDGSERNHYSRIHRHKSKKMRMLQCPNDPQMVGTSYDQQTMGRRNEVSRWNMGAPEWPAVKQHQEYRFQRQSTHQLGGPDLEEFRLRDASSAAQHALNMAKLKREKAQRLRHRLDHALHKAAVALMIAEAIEESERDLIGDG